MQLFDLTGKTALVIGGTRGIGLAIARGLQEAGASVWIHGSRQESTAAVAGQYGFEFLYGDLRDTDALDGMLRPLLDKLDRLDVLVNNAGFETHRPVEQGSREEMDAVYNVNAKAPYFLVQKLLPALKQAGKASVINVTSIHQRVPVRGQRLFTAWQSRRWPCTRGWPRWNWRRYGIRVNNLAPRRHPDRHEPRAGGTDGL